MEPRENLAPCIWFTITSSTTSLAVRPGGQIWTDGIPAEFITEAASHPGTQMCPLHSQPLILTECLLNSRLWWKL